MPGLIPAFPIPPTVEVLTPQTQRIKIHPRTDGYPWIGRLVIEADGWFKPGKRVGIGCNGLHPTRVGLYGPTPATIAGQYGHLVSPLNRFQGDLHHFQARNCKAGVYYVVVYDHFGQDTPRPLSQPTDLLLEVSSWRVWG